MTFLAGACAPIVFQGYGGQAMRAAGKLAMSHGDVLVSPIAVWEITREVAIGKLQRPMRLVSMARCLNGAGTIW